MTPAAPAGLSLVRTSLERGSKTLGLAETLENKGVEHAIPFHPTTNPTNPDAFGIFAEILCGMERTIEMLVWDYSFPRKNRGVISSVKYQIILINDSYSDLCPNSCKRLSSMHSAAGRIAFTFSIIRCSQPPVNSSQVISSGARISPG